MWWWLGVRGGNSAVLARPGPPSSSLSRAALRCADLGGDMGAGKRSSDALSTRVGVRMLRRIRELRAVEVRHIRLGHVIDRVAPRADRAFGDEAVLLEPLARRDLKPQACAPGGWGEAATACAVRCPWARAELGAGEAGSHSTYSSQCSEKGLVDPAPRPETMPLKSAG